ncbi:hypothetical protein B0H14DRAFT_2627794 [Mycena olivaceomarginata]|nr:hypothetical protein B0H14DRAFT_2627794 [Mycena olivaceomarginata]
MLDTIEDDDKGIACNIDGRQGACCLKDCIEGAQTELADLGCRGHDDTDLSTTSMDYATQETPLYGRQHRQSNPTPHMETHKQMQAEKENCQLARAAAKQPSTAQAVPHPRPRPLTFTLPQSSSAHHILRPLIHAPPCSPGAVFSPSGLCMSTSSDPVVYALTQLPQELEPHAHSEDTYSFQLPQDCIIRKNPICKFAFRLKFSLQVSTATTATCLLRQRTVKGGLQVASRVRAKWSKFYEAAPELSAPQGATSPPNVNVARRFTRYHRLKSG